MASRSYMTSWNIILHCFWLLICTPFKLPMISAIFHHLGQDIAGNIGQENGTFVSSAWPQMVYINICEYCKTDMSTSKWARSDDWSCTFLSFDMLFDPAQMAWWGALKSRPGRDGPQVGWLGAPESGWGPWKRFPEAVRPRMGLRVPMNREESGPGWDDLGAPLRLFGSHSWVH